MNSPNNPTKQLKQLFSHTIGLCYVGATALSDNLESTDDSINRTALRVNIILGEKVCLHMYVSPPFFLRVVL